MCYVLVFRVNHFLLPEFRRKKSRTGNGVHDSRVQPRYLSQEGTVFLSPANSIRLMTNRPWTRDEMVLVLNLYLKMPFGKMHKNNPDVIRIAHLTQRTPSAIALRLVNYASYDPQLKQRGISGMTHGGQKCAEYWNEFIDNREKLLYESECILAKYENISIDSKFEYELKDLPLDIIGKLKSAK